MVGNLVLCPLDSNIRSKEVRINGRVLYFKKKAEIVHYFWIRKVCSYFKRTGLLNERFAIDQTFIHTRGGISWKCVDIIECPLMYNNRLNIDTKLLRTWNTQFIDLTSLTPRLRVAVPLNCSLVHPTIMTQLAQIKSFHLLAYLMGLSLCDVSTNHLIVFDLSMSCFPFHTIYVLLW